MVYTASRTIYTHGYHLTNIETAKICFKSQTNASNFLTTNRQPFWSAFTNSRATWKSVCAIQNSFN